MNQNIRNIPLTRSRSGLNCLTESGGSWTNTGFVQIITGPTGQMKSAIYIPTRGDLCCTDHAVIPVRVNDCVVSVTRYREKIAIKVERIIAISDTNHTATLEQTDDPICRNAIQAAVEKSYDYHCRQPYYIKGKGSISGLYSARHQIL